MWEIIKERENVMVGRRERGERGAEGCLGNEEEDKWRLDKIGKIFVLI